MNAHRRTHVLLRPGVAVSFVLVALIWGSTWFVIKDQLAAANPSWSITWRFVIAGLAMAIWARIAHGSLRMSAEGHRLALIVAVSQFVCNFNFFYRAEIHLTSGIVAVMFALLMLPNALLGRIFLGSEVTARFLLGTGIALAGIALLLAHESMAMPANISGGASIGLGLVFVLGGIMSASVANVMQATEVAQRTPMLVMLAWAMGWGALGDALFAFAVSGPPVLPTSARYWGSIAYLAIIGSVITFPLYFKLIRDLGPGRAAYNGVLVPVVAMGLSTLFEGFRWSGLAIAGAVLAMIGLVVALRGRVEE